MYAARPVNDPIPPEDVVAFFSQNGYRVTRTASCWWYNEYHQSRVYFSFPPHRLVVPSDAEVGSVFRANPEALALRFLSPLSGQGRESFVWICRKPFDSTSPNGKSRNQIRRGLERCQVRTLTFDWLVHGGQEAHRDTMARHGQDSGSLGLNSRLDDCPGYGAWGAFVDDNLAAYIVTLCVEDWAHILVNRSADAYLKFYPNNALVFTVAQELLSRPGVSTVSYGWEPLASRGTLDHFKSGMGFQKEPVRQRIILRPWLRPLLNSTVCRAIAKMAGLHPNDRLQRLAGFCRIVAES